MADDSDSISDDHFRVAEDKVIDRGSTKKLKKKLTKREAEKSSK